MVAERPERTIRAFVAVKVVGPAAKEVTSTRKRLMSELPRESAAGMSWETGHPHVTLRFLGNMTRRQVRQLQHASPVTARPVQARFTLSLGPLGVFPEEGRPKVLWAGVHGDLEALRLARWRVDMAIVDAGLQYSDDYPFNPHVTLGRFSDDDPTDPHELRRAIAAASDPRPVSWDVGAITLMYSVRDFLGRVSYRALDHGDLRKGKA